MNPSAAIPEYAPWLFVAVCVVVAIMGLIGLAVILKVLRDLRHGLASELKREMGADREGKRVDVQQPLIVAGEKQFVTLAEHEKFERKMGEEFLHQNAARKKIYERIEAQGLDIKGLQTETKQQTVTLREIKEQNDDTNERINGVFGELRELIATVRSLGRGGK